jgi:hypothetical protein
MISYMTLIQALYGRTTISSSPSNVLASHELMMITQAMSQVTPAQLFGCFQSMFGGSGLGASRDVFDGCGPQLPAPRCTGMPPPAGECLPQSSSAFLLERLAASWCAPAPVSCEPTPVSCEPPVCPPVCEEPVTCEEPPYIPSHEGGGGGESLGQCAETSDPCSDPCGPSESSCADACSDADGADCSGDSDGGDCGGDSDGGDSGGDCGGDSGGDGGCGGDSGGDGGGGGCGGDGGGGDGGGGGGGGDGGGGGGGE